MLMLGQLVKSFLPSNLPSNFKACRKLMAELSQGTK